MMFGLTLLAHGVRQNIVEGIPPRFAPAAGSAWSYRESITCIGGVRGQVVSETLFTVTRESDNGYTANIVYGNRTVGGSKVDGYSTVVQYNPFPRNSVGDLESLEMVVFAAFQQRSDPKAEDWTATFSSKGDPVSIHYTLGSEQRIEKHNRCAEDLPAVRLFSGRPKGTEYDFLASYLEAEETRRVDFVASRSGRINSHLDGSMWISTLDGHLVALHSHSPDDVLDDGTRVETDTVRQEESSHWLGAAGAHIEAASVAGITLGIDTLTLTGIPGTLSCSPDWHPIVYGAGDHDNVFAAVRNFGRGRIAVIAHEGLFRGVAEHNNRRFMGQLFAWLYGPKDTNVAFLKDRKTWVTLSQYAITSDRIKSLSEQGIGVLVIGNAWEAFSPAEVEALMQYVKQGGGLLLAGLGWSWHQEHAEMSMDEYPMNVLAAPFDASWSSKPLDVQKTFSGEVSLRIKPNG